MQFTVAVFVASLLSAVIAAPAPPVITPPAKLPKTGGNDDFAPRYCPASVTVYDKDRMCLMGFCETPRDAPCKGTKTSTVWVDWRCTARPPTTTTVLAPCPDDNCKCPVKTVTATAF